MAFQNLLVHLLDCVFSVLWIDKVNESILTFHHNLSNIAVLVESLFKVLSDDASTDTSDIYLRRLSGWSLFSALSGLTSASVTSVVVASLVVGRAASTSWRDTVILWARIIFRR